MTVTELLLASTVVLLGSVIQGSVGFGLGILAAPLLLLINPILIPAPLLSAALVLTLLVARREHQSIDLHGVAWAVVGRIPGALLGAATLTVLPKRSTTFLVR
ncbi:MAG: TSUP family transporter, partial [bacterium]|nr:TSUP family transporter [bacterium]